MTAQRRPRDSEIGLDAYLDSEPARHALYRRSLTVVVVSQVFGGAGLAAGVTVGALLAQEVLGTEGLTGVPIALFTLGSATAAYLIGRLTQLSGRRNGLAAGFLAGALGAAGIACAATVGNAGLLFLSLFVYGAGTASNLQARYAGTDLAPPQRRATAVSIALVSTTFGAVAGPNLVDQTGRVALSIGVPALAGPFLLAALAYAAAGLVLLAYLRPDPYLVARALAHRTEGDPAAAVDSESLPADSRGVVVGATVMVVTMVTMVAIMTMTPVHMMHDGHSLGAVGFVIGVHIGAMYLPSLVTGSLVDRLGRLPMAAASGVILLAAGVVAAMAPGGSTALLTLALALLGLGWNIGLISGTALIVDSTPARTRAKTQGSVDVLIALAGASGGALSGLVVAGSSFSVLALASGLLALLLVPTVTWSRRDPRARHGTPSSR